MRPVLIYSSYRDVASISASSGWSADYPAANVLDLNRPTKVARGGTSVTIALGGPAPVSAVAIVQHTLSAAQTVTVQAGAYNSGAVAVGPSNGYRHTTPLVFPEVTASSVVVTFSAGADIGGIEVGKAWELPYITEGAQMGFLDAGREVVFLGGVSQGTDALRLRTYEAEIPYLATSITEDIAWSFQQEFGTARPFVFAEDIDNLDGRNCFLATNTALPGISSQLPGFDRFALRAVELVR